MTHHPDGGPPRHAVRGSTTMRMPGPIVRALLESTRWVARVAAWGGTPLDVNPSPWVGRLRGGVGAGAALLALHLEAVLRPPLTFTERVRHRMSRDRRHLLRTLTDKLAAREHVASLVGEGRQARLLASSTGRPSRASTSSRSATAPAGRSSSPRTHPAAPSSRTHARCGTGPACGCTPTTRTPTSWTPSSTACSAGTTPGDQRSRSCTSGPIGTSLAGSSSRSSCGTRTAGSPTT